MTSRTKKGLIAAGVVAALGAGGAAIAIGSSGSGDDEGTQKAITGEALQKASDVALAHTGGGKVTETDVQEFLDRTGSSPENHALRALLEPLRNASP